jgi:hypothetical protein
MLICAPGDDQFLRGQPQELCDRLPGEKTPRGSVRVRSLAADVLWLDWRTSAFSSSLEPAGVYFATIAAPSAPCAVSATGV